MWLRQCWSFDLTSSHEMSHSMAAALVGPSSLSHSVLQLVEAKAPDTVLHPSSYCVWLWFVLPAFVLSSALKCLAPAFLFHFINSSTSRAPTFLRFHSWPCFYLLLDHGTAHFTQILFDELHQRHPCFLLDGDVTPPWMLQFDCFSTAANVGSVFHVVWVQSPVSALNAFFHASPASTHLQATATPQRCLW